jgi:hypothetical protein
VGWISSDLQKQRAEDGEKVYNYMNPSTMTTSCFVPCPYSAYRCISFWLATKLYQLLGLFSVRREGGGVKDYVLDY